MRDELKHSLAGTVGKSLLIWICLFSLATACGGGGGSKSPPVPVSKEQAVIAIRQAAQATGCTTRDAQDYYFARRGDNLLLFAYAGGQVKADVAADCDGLTVLFTYNAGSLAPGMADLVNQFNASPAGDVNSIAPDIPPAYRVSDIETFVTAYLSANLSPRISRYPFELQYLFSGETEELAFGVLDKEVTTYRWTINGIDAGRGTSLLIGEGNLVKGENRILFTAADGGGLMTSYLVVRYLDTGKADNVVPAWADFTVRGKRDTGGSVPLAEDPDLIGISFEEGTAHGESLFYDDLIDHVTIFGDGRYAVESGWCGTVSGDARVFDGWTTVTVQATFVIDC